MVQTKKLRVKILMNKIVQNILSLSDKGKMYIKINTLENENQFLKETIKDKLYVTFMNKLGEPLEMNRLLEENKKLRKKLKIYKEMI